MNLKSLEEDHFSSPEVCIMQEKTPHKTTWELEVDEIEKLLNEGHLSVSDSMTYLEEIVDASPSQLVRSCANTSQEPRRYKVRFCQGRKIFE